jgi:hypothetical protein
MTSAHVGHILSQAFALVLSLSCHILLISAETKASGPFILLESSSLILLALPFVFALGLAYAFPGEE